MELPPVGPVNPADSTAPTVNLDSNQTWSNYALSLALAGSAVTTASENLGFPGVPTNTNMIQFVSAVNQFMNAWNALSPPPQDVESNSAMFAIWDNLNFKDSTGDSIASLCSTDASDPATAATAILGSSTLMNQVIQVQNDADSSEIAAPSLPNAHTFAADLAALNTAMGAYGGTGSGDGPTMENTLNLASALTNFYNLMTSSGTQTPAQLNITDPPLLFLYNSIEGLQSSTGTTLFQAAVTLQADQSASNEAAFNAILSTADTGPNGTANTAGNDLALYIELTVSNE